MRNMRHIRIRSMKDLQLAKEVYRYETKVHNQALSAGVYRFSNSFRDAMENTLRAALQSAIFFGIRKLTSKK